MRDSRILLGILGGAAVGAASLFIAWDSAGGGHGTYISARCLFPYTMYFAMTINDRITAPLIVLALLQFPAHGFAIGLAASRGRTKAVLASIIILHTVAIGLCFSVKSDNFSELHSVRQTASPKSPHSPRAN